MIRTETDSGGEEGEEEIDYRVLYERMEKIR